MAFQFRKHYTLEEARALLPRVRRWLDRIQELRSELDASNRALKPLIESGNDVGGPHAENLIRGMADLKSIVQEFRSRDIQIKDIDRGLIDFPALMGGREVFLCWEKDEPDIEFWHDIDTGYAGRERL